jgi:hypothetical protein
MENSMDKEIIFIMKKMQFTKETGKKVKRKGLDS